MFRDFFSNFEVCLFNLAKPAARTRSRHKRMKRILTSLLALCFLAGFFHNLEAAPTETQGWKAGVARAIITPEEPTLLAGYAGRDKAADGKIMELWAKALALEDAEGHRAVFITTDLLGIPQGIYEHVSQAVKERFHLDPAQVVLSASHTHCGPVLSNALYDIYPLTDQTRGAIERYSARLEMNLVDLAGRALSDLRPARLMASTGKAGFAVNRRTNAEKNVPRLQMEGGLKGPVDHSVPVLAACGTNGQLRAILFGYACHNTVMAFNQYSGDYAGYAQIALEKSHPGASALFFMGCGGDQNPLPRRKLELAERYGNMLAAAVEEALITAPRQLVPMLSTKMEMVELALGPSPAKAELEPLVNGTNITARRWSARLLGEVNSGKTLRRSYPFPLQSWRLGDQLLVTLGGEPVVDYALKFRGLFGEQTWVAGYCNDVMTYIPSARVLKEGGYEGGSAMLAYGMPAFRWGDDVEEKITSAAKRLVGTGP
jgi:hypothetical protein